MYLYVYNQPCQQTCLLLADLDQPWGDSCQGSWHFATVVHVQQWDGKAAMFTRCSSGSSGAAGRSSRYMCSPVLHVRVCLAGCCILQCTVWQIIDYQAVWQPGLLHNFADLTFVKTAGTFAGGCQVWLSWCKNAAGLVLMLLSILNDQLL